jgi:hypothetical protein
MTAEQHEVLHEDAGLSSTEGVEWEVLTGRAPARAGSEPGTP